MPLTQAVLFDLDGTLADTARDLGTALNRLLIEEGRPPQPYDAIRPIASHGVKALINLGFSVANDHPYAETLRLRFLEHYNHCMIDATCLFTGIAPLIECLAQRGLLWGIVTNKPARFTQQLVPALAFSIPPAIVVSGDTVGVAKPDPRPMWYAAEQIGIPPAHCMYVGDAKRDIDAGRAAGMRTVLANWGYIGHTDHPDEWGADYRITHPIELLPLL